jgi:Ca2+-binding EF-hand superfamily protein
MSKIYPFDEANRKVEEVLSEVDFNNDGTISFSEFMTVTVKKEKLLSEEMLKKAFDLFDSV